jgi:hypothetical protein
VATRADLADVCVVNGVGEVVPYALRRPAGERADAAPFAPLPLFPLRTADRSPSEALKLHLRSGTTSIDLDRPPEAGPAEVIRGYLLDARGAHEPLTTLRLAWPADAAEFSARVSVEASEDLAHWRTVARDAAIVNLHFGGQDFERAEIALGDGSASFLRLSFESAPPALTLSAVSGARRPRQAELARLPVTVPATAGAATGEYQFDLGARLPLDRVSLELPEQNTVVEAEFLARPDDAGPWRSVARGRLYRLRVPGMADLVNPPLALPATAARHWQVRIAAAGGGLGRGLPRLSGGWLADQLLFVARGPAPFRLLYGNAAATPFAVAADTLVDAAGQLRASGRVLEAETASVGAPLAYGGPARLVPPVPAPDWKRWLLWTILVLGVAALGWMALRLIRES